MFNFAATYIKSWWLNLYSLNFWRPPILMSFIFNSWRLQITESSTNIWGHVYLKIPNFEALIFKVCNFEIDNFLMTLNDEDFHFLKISTLSFAPASLNPNPSWDWVWFSSVPACLWFLSSTFVYSQFQQNIFLVHKLC